jgi:hypothetical protein
LDNQARESDFYLQYQSEIYRWATRLAYPIHATIEEVTSDATLRAMARTLRMVELHTGSTFDGQRQSYFSYRSMCNHHTNDIIAPNNMASDKKNS